jgi:hypothetical protein
MFGGCTGWECAAGLLEALRDVSSVFWPNDGWIIKHHTINGAKIGSDSGKANSGFRIASSLCKCLQR